MCVPPVPLIGELTSPTAGTSTIKPEERGPGGSSPVWFLRCAGAARGACTEERDIVSHLLTNPVHAVMSIDWADVLAKVSLASLAQCLSSLELPLQQQLVAAAASERRVAITATLIITVERRGWLSRLAPRRMPADDAIRRDVCRVRAGLRAGAHPSRPRRHANAAP